MEMLRSTFCNSQCFIQVGTLKLLSLLANHHCLASHHHHSYTRLVHTTILKVQHPCKVIGQLPGGEAQKCLLLALISLDNYQGCPGKWPKELVVSRQDKRL